MSRHFRTSEGHQKAFLCSSDRNTATSEPVKECLQSVVLWYLLGSSGNCFLPSCRRIERDADSARYLSFLCVCASSFDHCANGLRGWGGGFRNIPRADVPSSLVAVASNSNLLLLSSCFTDTRPSWTGIFCLTNRVFSVYHIPKPFLVFGLCVPSKVQHNPMFLKKPPPTEAFFFAITFKFYLILSLLSILTVSSICG